jgi:cation transport protein ChaC
MSHITNATTNKNLEWIFSYGSLMWNPSFSYIDKQPATLTGYHRSFCIYSHHYRGTPEQPGLVLGLDEGGVCHGIAFQVDKLDWLDVISYLDERELIGYAYDAVEIDIQFECSGTVAQAYTYIANTSHPKYAGDVGFERSVEIIMNAVGISGSNRDYLVNSYQQLKNHGYTEPNLFHLKERIELLTKLIDQDRST